MRTSLPRSLGVSTTGNQGGFTNPGPQTFPALVRGEDGGLDVRTFATAADAQAACAAHETPTAPVRAADHRRAMTPTYKLARDIGLHPATVRRNVLAWGIPAVAQGERCLMVPNRICRLIMLYGFPFVRGLAARGEL